MYIAETKHVHVHTNIKYTIMYSLTHNDIGSMKETETIDYLNYATVA